MARSDSSRPLPPSPLLGDAVGVPPHAASIKVAATAAAARVATRERIVGLLRRSTAGAGERGASSGDLSHSCFGPMVLPLGLDPHKTVNKSICRRDLRHDHRPW